MKNQSSRNGAKHNKFGDKRDIQIYKHFNIFRCIQWFDCDALRGVPHQSLCRVTPLKLLLCQLNPFCIQARLCMAKSWYSPCHSPTLQNESKSIYRDPGTCHHLSVFLPVMYILIGPREIYFLIYRLINYLDQLEKNFLNIFGSI